MTQEQALAAYRALHPDHAEDLAVTRVRTIGCKRGHDNEFQLWDWSTPQLRLTNSHNSWEHALALESAQIIARFPEDNSPVEESTLEVL